MATNTLDFNLLAAGSDVAAPTGYTKPPGSVAVNIVDLSTVKYFTGGASNSVWYDNTVLTGSLIKASILTGPTNGSAIGCALIDASGNGYFHFSSDSAGQSRIYLLVASQLSTLLTSVGRTHADNQTLDITWETGGQIKMWAGGVQVGSTVTNTTYTPTFAASVSRGGRARSLTSEYTPAQTLNTLTDPLVAGAAFSGTCTGFTDGAATLSSNGLSVAVTVASGAFSGTWPIAVDEQAYPTLPKTEQTITLTQGGNTATITSDLEQPAGDDIVNFVSPVTDDDTYLTYYIEQDGFTADGGQFVFTPYSDLVIGTDGGALVTGAGTIVGYFIPATGTGAGNAYYYTFNIIDGGAVVNGGLSVAGLSVSGLSVSGSSVVGL